MKKHIFKYQLKDMSEWRVLVHLLYIIYSNICCYDSDGPHSTDHSKKVIIIETNWQLLRVCIN